MNGKITVLKVRLILYNQGKIMLLKQTKANGGNYTLVGGTIEHYEFAKDSLIREAKEEAGISLKPEDLSLIHVLHKKTSAGQRITLYFRASNWEGKLRSREPEKFRAAVWFPLDNLPANLTDTVGHVLEAYRRGEMYSEYRKKA